MQSNDKDYIINVRVNRALYERYKNMKGHLSGRAKLNSQLFEKALMAWIEENEKQIQK
jgi:post-segregation antitoxin (ccd killing protein)